MAATSISVSPAFGTASFQGRNGAGPIEVTGLKSGDAILFSSVNGEWQPPGTLLELVVSTAGFIQQLDSSDLSSRQLEIMFIRPVKSA